MAPPNQNQPTTLLRGIQLRTLRTDAGISTHKAAEALGLPEQIFTKCEDHDLVFPTYHARQLQVLGLKVPEPATARLPPGKSLHLWRVRGRLDPVELGRSLKALGESIELVELLSWSILPEWVPALRRLGFDPWMPGDSSAFPEDICAEDPRRREAAIHMLKAGWSVQKTCEATGATSMTVTKWRAAAGILPIVLTGAEEARAKRAQIQQLLRKSKKGQRFDLLRGLELRTLREKEGIPIRRMAEIVDMQFNALDVAERHDLVIPAEWFPALERSKLIRSIEDLQAPPMLTGMALGKFCADKDIWLESLAYLLGTKPVMALLVMSRDLPVCPEWLPALGKLGLVEPETPATEGAQPQLPGVLLRGPWLRELRTEKRLSAVRLGRLLNISKSTLYQAECHNLTLPRSFLATLRKHNLIPGTLEVIEPPAGGGRDLVLRLRTAGLSIDELAKKTGVPRSTIEMVLSRDWPVPPEWELGPEPSAAPSPVVELPQESGPNPQIEADSWSAIAHSYKDDYYELGIVLRLFGRDVRRTGLAKFDCPWCMQSDFLLYQMPKGGVAGACRGSCRPAGSTLKLYSVDEIIAKATGSSWKPAGSACLLSDQLSLPVFSPESVPAPAAPIVPEMGLFVGDSRGGGYIAPLDHRPQPSEPPPPESSPSPPLALPSQSQTAQAAPAAPLPPLKAPEDLEPPAPQKAAPESQPPKMQAPAEPAPAQAPVPTSAPPVRVADQEKSMQAPKTPPPGAVTVVLTPEMIRDLGWLIPGQNFSGILLYLAGKFIDDNRTVLDKLLENQKLAGILSQPKTKPPAAAAPASEPGPTPKPAQAPVTGRNGGYVHPRTRKEMFAEGLQLEIPEQVLKHYNLLKDGIKPTAAGFQRTEKLLADVRQARAEFQDPSTLWAPYIPKM